MQFSRAFIQSCVPEVVCEGSEFASSPSFCIDSRLIEKGDIFVALTGQQVDGHSFLADVINKGASGLIIHNDQKSLEFLHVISAQIRERLAIARVPDTFIFLEKCATAWRSLFKGAVVGVTGTVGKTSTKELIVRMCAQDNKRVLASVGNQNTLLGASLTLLKLRQEHDCAVVEMAISKRGEMARQAAMVRPTTAVITTVGHGHMEGLGSLADIATEKRGIFSNFGSDNIGVINGDQALLAVSYPHPVIRFGAKMTNQIQARKIQVHHQQISFTLSLYDQRVPVTIPTGHLGQLTNGLAAAAVAHHLGVSLESIVSVLQNPVLVKSRFEQLPVKVGNGFVIDDCYNANPESMKAALLAFEKLPSAGAKVAVIGDMLELGAESAFWHRQVGRFLRKVPSLCHVVFVGEHIKWAKKTMPLFLTCDTVPSWSEAINCLDPYLKNGGTVLVKGSHGVGLSNLIREISK